MEDHLPSLRKLQGQVLLTPARKDQILGLQGRMGALLPRTKGIKENPCFWGVFQDPHHTPLHLSRLLSPCSEWKHCTWLQGRPQGHTDVKPEWQLTGSGSDRCVRQSLEIREIGRLSSFLRELVIAVQ